MRRRNEGGALRRVPFAILSAFVLAVAGSALAQAALVNFAHLDFLTDTFDVEGEEHLGVWIYAEPSPTEADAYVHRADEDEGSTDIDDIARAAIAYLWEARERPSEATLATARGLLEFVMAMQADDGEFYNFVFPDGRINRLGITSRKGAGFWAARGLWALAEGIPVFAEHDPAFAERLRVAFLRGVPPFVAKIGPRYGTYLDRLGYRVPAWLPDDGADVASNLLLALATFLRHDHDDDVLTLHDMVAEGLTDFQYGPPGTYPFLAHPSFARDPQEWHAWGSRQGQALAQASLATGDAAALASAEEEAGHFFVHLLASQGPIALMNPAVRAYPQIAYGMEAVASSLFALSDASGKGVFDELGGLMTSWLLGNNELRRPLYEPSTGRTFDGLERGVINQNSGAESTITALMALVQAEARPAAAAMLDLVWLEKHDEIVIELESGSDFGEAPETEIDARASGQVTAVLRTGASITVGAEVPRAGRYLVYAIHGSDPWEAGASVFVQRQLLATLDAGGADESHFRMTELGSLDLEAGTIDLTVTHRSGRDMRFDALVLRPEVMWKRYGRPGERLLLLKSWSADHVSVPLEDTQADATGATRVDVYDRLANLVPEATQESGALQLPPYGFALVRWDSSESLPPLELAGARQGPRLALPEAFASDGFVALDLERAFNNDAFSSPSQPLKGNFDSRSGVLGATYPAERAPASLERIELGGVPFLFPPTDADANNVAFHGQRLEVPPGHYDELHLLGVSEQGNYQDTVRLVYEDGSVDEIPLGLSDWCQTPRYGEAIAFAFEQRRGAGGAIERITCRILVQLLPVRADSSLLRVDLPDRETMHLFALTLRHAR
ncbi:MAG: hypothetical protein H0U69_13325 [Trueperaceae bacterium]|nr:hypothetical protein [Trueperaceae bacterium]